MSRDDCYNGNTQIKRAGVIHNWTPHELKEYQKCAADPVYFAKTYVKVVTPGVGLNAYIPYEYQERMFKHFNKNAFNIVLSVRQSGKSISSVIWLLWYAIFHEGKTIALLANKGALAKEMLGRITLALENLPFFLQPGCKTLNKMSIHFDNNSKILAAATSASSIRGWSCDVIFLDEFAFVHNAAQFYTSTYPVISAGKDPKVIITSTANGVGNMFHKLYEGAVQGTNSYKHFRVDWWDVPGRDEAWKKTTIANTSQLQFDQEFGNCIAGDSIVTIRHGEQVGDLSIERLYDVFTKGTCRYPLEIMTPNGFQLFYGVKMYRHKKGLKIEFDGDEIITVSKKHRFILPDGKTIYARDLLVGTTILGGFTVSGIEEETTSRLYYDPINVEGGSIFTHDGGFTSHNTFLGTGDTLINAEAILGLRAKDAIEYYREVRYYFKPEEDHTYVMTVDPSKGRGQDYSTFTIFDITSKPFKQVAVYRNNTISPLLIPDLIVKVAESFNNAIVLIENNNGGDVVCNAVYYEYEYENTFVESTAKSGGVGVTMTKRVKRIGCSNMKDMIETGTLEIYDADTIQEISCFEAKGGSFQASDGNHDDLVMNIVLFAWFVSSDAFGNFGEMDLKNMMFADRIREMENDVLPFGFITAESYGVDDNDHSLSQHGYSTIVFPGMNGDGVFL